MKHWPLWLLVALLLSLSACSALPLTSRAFPVASQPEAAQPSRVLSERPLRQSWLLSEEGLSAIEVVLVVPRHAPTLAQRPLRWQLRNSHQQIIREGEVETAGYPHNTPIRLHFAPVQTMEQVELALSAPSDAQIALWTSTDDRYLQGNLADNGVNSNVDLHFTLFAQETLPALAGQVRAEAARWQRAALWIPLLLITPGLLLAWLFQPGGKVPLAPYSAGLSLALAPLVYAWTRLIGMRLYEPLVQSLFQAAALFLLLLMIRQPARVRAAWRTRWRGTLLLLLLFVGVGIGTWLLAARSLVGIDQSGDITQLTQTLVSDGLFTTVDAPLPPAALGATVAQLSHLPVGESLLLGALMLGVSLIPALFVLSSEVGVSPAAALSVLPLAWLWPTPWAALQRGDLTVLYSIVLLPFAVALGLRALRAPTRPWASVALAAIPLATLALLQGIGIVVPWLLTLLLAVAKGGIARPAPDAPEQASLDSLPLRALAWLALALLLWLPTWFYGTSLAPHLAWTGGLTLLLVAILLAALVGWLARRAPNAGLCGGTARPAAAADAVLGAKHRAPRRSARCVHHRHHPPRSVSPRH